MNTKEITIWTSEPDYEEYREILAEDMPDATEAERISYLYEANEACLEFQRRELSMDLGMPILILEETDAGYYRGAGILQDGDLSACFQRPPREAGSCRWIIDGRGDLCLCLTDCFVEKRFIYRLERPEITIWDQLDLEGFIARGCLSRRELCSCTLRLGDAAAQVYGLELAPDADAAGFFPGKITAALRKNALE